MKLLYDQQIFGLRKFGGISRYFNELMKIDADKLSEEKIDPELFWQPKLLPQDIYFQEQLTIFLLIGIRNFRKMEKSFADLI